MLERIAARLTLSAAIMAILVAALVVQTVRIEGFKVWPISHKGLKAELSDARRTLREITAPRDEQRKTSERNVRIVESDPGVKIVERIIRVPNPANCGTPQLDTEARELL